MKPKERRGKRKIGRLRVLLHTFGLGLMVMMSTFGIVAVEAAGASVEVKTWVMPATVAVRLDDVPPAQPVSVIDWAGARQEYEHAQVCLRSERAVSNVRVLLDDLKGPHGVIARDNLAWRQVGYVNCKPMPDDYEHKYTAEPGWWPDPLLEVEDFDLEASTTQPVWITIHVPAGTAPGTYEGAARLVCDRGMVAEVPINLEVWPLDLPNPGRFNTVFSFHYPFENGPEWQDVIMTNIYGEFTPELKRAYFEFLGRHRIPADNLYFQSALDGSFHGPRPTEDYELLLQCGGKRFNLTYAPDAWALSRHADGIPGMGIPAMLERLAPMVEKLKHRGLLRYAYVYGFDENPDTSAPVIREVFGAVKQRWPELRTMAVLNWAPAVDVPLDTWVISYEQHDPETAARWRAAGKEYWWYHCCVPVDPHMNTFVEMPRINGRLMMWLAAANEVDGWLYYAVDGWRGERRRKIVEREGKGPRTDFDPATFRHSNGDGNFIYPGPKGPLSSTRLENLTDGIEDWELFAQLRERWGRAPEAGSRDLVSDLTRRLVRTSKDRTPDPELLEKTRREAARRLIQAGQGTSTGRE